MKTSRRLSLVATVAAGAAALLGTAPAEASVALGAGTFSSRATCSPFDGLVVMTGTTASAGGYAMIYLYDYSSGQWIHGGWHDVSNYSFQLDKDFTFSDTPSWHYVWMQYAQWTGNAWVQSGEFITTYSQRNANGYGTSPSDWCYA